MFKNINKSVIIIGIVLILFVLNWNLYAEKTCNYFPEIEEPEHLNVIDISNLRSDEFTLIISLQGILAQDKPEIYINNPNTGYDYWLEKMQKKS